jgi:hypothetical protein
MGKRKDDKWVVRWQDDFVHSGARFDLLDRKGHYMGRLEMLSQPQIECGENEGYVTIRIKAACIAPDGQPMSGANIMKSYDSGKLESRRVLHESLISFRFVLEQLLRSLEEKLHIPEYFVRLENSRSSVLFHYILLERQMVDAFPEYMVRLQRIVFTLDEAFEMSIEKIGEKDIYTRSVELFRDALRRIKELEVTISEKGS